MRLLGSLTQILVNQCIDGSFLEECQAVMRDSFVDISTTTTTTTATTTTTTVTLITKQTQSYNSQAFSLINSL